MGMFLNRLVKRDSTRPAYSSDHANPFILLFINHLCLMLYASHLTLSKFSLKKRIYLGKYCSGSDLT